MVLEACYSRGKPAPDAIRDAPSLLPSLGMYYEAYMDLGTCRGMGSVIPWTAMRQYGDWMGLKGDGFSRFVFIMKEMDAEREDYYEKKRQRESGPGGKS